MKNKEVLKYLNLARQYPKYYVGLIDEQLNSFVDQFNIKLGDDIIYETIQGKTLWEEAKKFLLNQQPLRPFDFHEGLAKAAFDHSKDIVKNKSNGHTGSDGSTFIQRIQRYCKKGKGSMIELLGTTHKITGKNSIELGILNFIIDDGVTNRGHRRALFSKQYKYVGLEFCQFQDKIYSVVTITQVNLQILVNLYNSIGTSMNNFGDLPESIPPNKGLNSMPQNQKASNSLLQKEKGRNSNIQAQKENNVKLSSQRSVKKQSFSLIQPDKSAAEWTFKNVDSNIKAPSSKKKFPEKFQHQPSIFQQVDQSIQSVNQNKNKARESFIKANSRKDVKENSNPDLQINIKPSKQSSKSIINNQSSHFIQKQSSTISVKDCGQSNKDKTSQGFGLISEVQNFKQKNKINSVFSKSNSSSIGFGSGISKRIVQKSQKIRNWCEDGFTVKEVTTMIKYEDGDVENIIQKHSILKDSSNSIHSQH